MAKQGTSHGMGARELRLLAVFRPKNCPDTDEELLVALLRALIYHKTLLIVLVSNKKVSAY